MATAPRRQANAPAPATAPTTPNPNANLRMSEAARRRLQGTERVVPRYYNDPVGNCTYGAGILAHGRTPCTAAELGQPVTEAQMNVALNARITDAERAVRRNVNTQALTQAQMDALVSLTYNVGATGARGTFTLVNSGNLTGAANNISSLVSARNQQGRLVVLPGLVTRRAEESAPFRPAPQPNAAQQNQPNAAAPRPVVPQQNRR